MLRVIISCQHLKLSSSLQKHTEDKVCKACDHLDSHPANCQVHLSVDGHINKAEVLMHYQGHDFTAHANNGSDMYAAIDAAATRLRRQIDSFNGKHSQHR